MGTNKKIRAEKLGKRAEWLASIALMLKGYRIVARRYKTKLGEIDLIARKRDLIAIVEVKARPTPIEAIDAVTAEAKRRIGNASDLWLAKQPDFPMLSIRYDVIAVCPRQWPVHFENVW